MPARCAVYALTCAAGQRLEESGLVAWPCMATHLDFGSSAWEAQKKGQLCRQLRSSAMAASSLTS